MMPRGRFEYRRLAPVAILPLIVFAAPFFLAFSFRIRFNISPSLPLGLYRETSDPRARLAEFCPLEPYARFAVERGYRSPGNCPDGAAPLMKPIIAEAGDTVEVSDAGIIVNGNLIPNTAPKRVDSNGRPMYPWHSGNYRVQEGFVWVASSYNMWSFDGRYFGPIPAGAIRYRLRPFLTF